MEKISGACAMDWSIQLDKALRSNSSSSKCNGVEAIAPKLRTWSRESLATLGVSSMFGLVQGEDRVFANAILLRLSDAFRYGDNLVRLSVVRLFLSESNSGGILVNHGVTGDSYLEMLRRVKFVFDTGDVEARALSLCLYGCWAHFASNNADVRHMVLSSFLSPNDLEVKASLFAAGCMSRLLEDFACITLSAIVPILRSQASTSVKIAAARVFGKMQCSTIIVCRAYKAGKKLLQDAQSDEVALEILMSLSRLALKSIILIPEQVVLLTSFLGCKYSSLVKGNTLKCLYFLLRIGGQNFPFSLDLIIKLSLTIEDSNLGIDLQCDALVVLRKILHFSLQKYLSWDVPEFVKLVTVLVDVAKSSAVGRGQLIALSILTYISCNLTKSDEQRWPMISCLSTESFHLLGPKYCEDDPMFFNHCIINLITDMMVSVFKHAERNSNEPAFAKTLETSVASSHTPKQESQFLLNLLLHLIEQFPKSCPLLLTKVASVVEESIHFHYTSNTECSAIDKKASREDTILEKVNHLGGLHISHGKMNEFTSGRFIPCVCRFMSSCLSVLDHTDLVNNEVLTIVKRFLECIGGKSLGDNACFEIFSLSLQSSVIEKSCQVENEPSLFHNEYVALEFAKNMQKRMKHWIVYKAGTHSASKGLWLAATFSFRKLVDQVKSDSSKSWLRSLMLLTGAESEIRLLLHPKHNTSLVHWLLSDSECRQPCAETEEMSCQMVHEIDQLSFYGEKLTRIYNRICSSELMLASARTSLTIFSFQLWFLCLRAKVLEILVAIFGLLDSHLDSKDNFQNGEYLEQNMMNSATLEETLQSSAVNLASISRSLMKLAKEYDLLATSFMDIDYGSYQSISILALNCSLLAFCTSFPLHFARSSAVNDINPSSISCLRNSSYSASAHDLMVRLWDIDNESAVDLQKYIGLVNNEQCFLSSTHICTNHTVKATLVVCRFAILNVHCLNKKVEEVKDREMYGQLFKDGLWLLHKIVIKWMDLSFQPPKYYFRTRHCISSELFISSTEPASPSKVSIRSGMQLALNLCIQLKNASSNNCSRIITIFCILACSASNHISSQDDQKEEDISDGQPWKTGLMVDLNEKLILFIKNGYMETGMSQSQIADDNNWVTTCVCFEPNKKGQGFSTCLLDVSIFPEGTYQINWHACCIGADGSCWSLPPINVPHFSITKSSTV